MVVLRVFRAMFLFFMVSFMVSKLLETPYMALISGTRAIHYGLLEG